MSSLSWDDLVNEAGEPEAPMEAGMYDVIVDEATYQLSKNGDPQLKLVYQIEGGPHNGRKIWDWATAASSSDFARKMFVQTVTSLLGADAKLNLDAVDSEEVSAPFHGKRAKAQVKLEPREDTGELRPQISKIFPLEKTGNAPAPANASGEATPPPPPPA